MTEREDGSAGHAATGRVLVQVGVLGRTALALLHNEGLELVLAERAELEAAALRWSPQVIIYRGRHGRREWLSLCRRLRAATPRSHIIALVRLPSGTDFVDGFAAGVSYVLRAHCDAAMLLSRVTDCLSRRPQPSESPQDSTTPSGASGRKRSVVQDWMLDLAVRLLPRFLSQVECG